MTQMLIAWLFALVVVALGLLAIVLDKRANRNRLARRRQQAHRRMTLRRATARWVRN